MNCNNALYVLIIVAIAIVIRYVYLQQVSQYSEERVVKNDFMNQIIIDLGKQKYSWWPISHFVLYAILAYMFPDCWLLLIVIGILWECIEYVVNVLAYSKLAKHGMVDKVPNVQYATEWWAANGQDIGFNLAGILVGLVLAKLL